MRKKIIKIISMISIFTMVIFNCSFMLYADESRDIAEYIGEGASGSVEYYASDDEIIKVEVVTSVDEHKAKENMSRASVLSNYNNEKKEFTEEKTCNAMINIAKRDITESEKNLLSKNLLSAQLIEKSNQAYSSDGRIIATLKVKYSYSGNNLRLDSATGTYSHVGYESGIVGKSSNLYYSSQGTIYKNGVFQKNGTIGFNRNYSSPSFNNVQLMPSGVYVNNPTISGVNYTLYCTRGVSATVYLPF